MSVQSGQLIAAARRLAARVDCLKFKPPVTHVYNPLDYARQPYEAYARKFGNGKKRVIFLGMNPGPFGMAQTGVPFGEVSAVRNWLGIEEPVQRPRREHPRRPVAGFACARSEVSGRRLWRLFAERFGPAENFFQEHFVANYCPLVFCGRSGCNLTPEQLPKAECHRLFEACDDHLRSVAEALEPEWIVGIGLFAASRAKIAAEDGLFRTGGILHPSPANPSANRDWAGTVTRQLKALGVWK
ncbi:MAG: single-stranded DNA-binding protein [Verrucomicrobia bacterium]|nr:single-stranded DNA-binding protein [Verrucomicrobiota bacterium]MDE3099035.1 single-stranded DNA-binding protein [Verrucomicrobiota bacterium]